MLKPQDCWAMAWSVKLMNGNLINQQPVLVTSTKGINDAMDQIRNHGKHQAPDVVEVVFHKIEHMGPPLMIDDGEDTIEVVQ